jgi:GTP pyrophosphokinase
MIGAKINGMIVPIDRVLQNGEIVEILTSSSSKGPSRDWLKIVATSDAKNRIRQWFKKEKRADNIILGRSMIEGEIKKAGYIVNEATRTEAVENVAVRNGFATADDLYNTIGYGGLPISKVKNKIVDEIGKIISPVEPAPVVTEENMVTAKPKKIRSNSGIIVDGESGCSVKFAKCCNPLPGDKVIGFITKGYGISIHKCDCPNVINGKKNPEYAERWVSASWDEDSYAKRSLFEANLQIRVDDRIGMLADISVALADMRVDILQINVQTSSGGSLVSLKVGCKNTEHYNSIVSRLRSIPGIYDVSRGFVN